MSVSRRCASKPRHMLHIHRFECVSSASSQLFNLHRRKLRPTSIRSDTISLPACLPARRSYRCPQSLQLDWRWWLSAMSDQPSTVCFTRCVYYQYVCSRASHATHSLNRTFIRDSHTQENRSCLRGQRVQCILPGLQTACLHCRRCKRHCWKHAN